MQNSLTQEEVNNLPDGTKVLVTWTGGNGPYLYTIKRFPSNPFPLAEECDCFIDFVGQAPPFTIVNLLD